MLPALGGWGGAAGAAGNSGGSTSSSGSSSSGGSSSAPGVTSNAINVGAISSLTGPLASNFADFIPGVKAYFSMINAQGGVNGRKINLQWNLDDQGVPSQFTADAHTLVNQDHAFATFISSYWFSPGFFVQNGIPTYGYNTSDNWAGPPNLFGAGGNSYLCISCSTPSSVYLAKQVKAKTTAFLAYNVKPSNTTCQDTVNAYKQAGIKVGYVDLNVPVDGNITPAVQHIQSSGANFVMSCMDVQENISLAKALKQYGIKATQFWLNGNDASVLNQNSDLMQNVYFNTNYVPLTAPANVYPGMKAYKDAMQKYQPKYVGQSLAAQGWMAASTFVMGLKAAGSNVTQQRVIQLTNQITNDSTNGFTTVTNWKTAHTTVTWPICTAFIKVKGKQFVSALAPGKQVFICFNKGNKNPKPVKPTPGTPGANS